MPRLTAPQMCWTGAVLLVLGVAGGAVNLHLYDEFLWAAPEVFSLLADGASVLGSVGAALLGGGIVVGVVQRHRDLAAVAASSTGENPRPPSG